MQYGVGHSLHARHRIEVVLPLCKGELEGVEYRLNIVYPPSPSLTKGGNKCSSIKEPDFLDIMVFD